MSFYFLSTIYYYTDMRNILTTLRKFTQRFWFKNPPVKKKVVSLPEELRHMVLSLDVEDLAYLYYPGAGDRTINPLWTSLPAYTFNLSKVNATVAANKLPVLPFMPTAISMNRLCYKDDYYLPFREIGRPFLMAVEDFCDAYMAISNEVPPTDRNPFEHHMKKIAILDRIANDILIIIKAVYDVKAKQTN